MPVQEESHEYGTFDPSTAVRSVIIEPPVEEHVSGTSDSLADADTPSNDPSFDDRWVEPFEGLLYLGALTDTFSLATHKFTLKSLNNDELMLVGLAIKQFAGTEGESRAYTVAMVAASVLLVDGEPLKVPLGPTTGIEALMPRFEQVALWFPQVTDKIFERYLLLEAKVDEVLERLGNSSG